VNFISCLHLFLADSFRRRYILITAGLWVVKFQESDLDLSLQSALFYSLNYRSGQLGLYQKIKTRASEIQKAWEPVVVFRLNRLSESPLIIEILSAPISTTSGLRFWNQKERLGGTHNAAVCLQGCFHEMLATYKKQLPSNSAFV